MIALRRVLVGLTDSFGIRQTEYQRHTSDATRYLTHVRCRVLVALPSTKKPGAGIKMRHARTCVTKSCKTHP
jgi:hypothetical protein